jgi:hypothetical protein
MMRISLLAATLLLTSLTSLASPRAVALKGTVVDVETGKPIPCRVTIRGADGKFHVAKSEGGVPYTKERGTSAEGHVTLTTHPFEIELAPGAYTVTVQRGKEYLPDTRRVEIADKPVEIEVRLRRWIDLAARGWYSGETHVHRPLGDLANLQQAEDLNVAFPFTWWVLEAFTSPQASNQAGGGTAAGEKRFVEVDATHVYSTRSTEYELFRVNKKSHTLGAFFILDHKTAFEEGAPPVRPVAKRAHAEGALLELDKHNWPWSMMIAPVMEVDLFELANNHMWETDFAFRDFGSPAPEFMKIEKDAKGMTEAGWIDFGFRNYYALLNCGLRLRPTAGCASGVHPVPVGFGRVYAKVDGAFGFDAWMKALNAGRTFVTTGPMLFVDVKGGVIEGTAESAVPLSRIEIVVDGEVTATVKPENKDNGRGGFASAIRGTFAIDASHWVAVRCWEDRPDQRPRWAHTAPVFHDVPGKPVRPPKAEVEFLLKRVEDELARNTGVLPGPALDEYRDAATFYRSKLELDR